MIITNHAKSRYIKRISPQADDREAGVVLADAATRCVRLPNRTYKGQVVWEVKNPDMRLVTKHDPVDGMVLVTVLEPEYELDEELQRAISNGASGRVHDIERPIVDDPEQEEKLRLNRIEQAKIKREKLNADARERRRKKAEETAKLTASRLQKCIVRWTENIGSQDRKKAKHARKMLRKYGADPAAMPVVTDDTVMQMLSARFRDSRAKSSGTNAKKQKS